jgi:hypothetical protein
MRYASPVVFVLLIGTGLPVAVAAPGPDPREVAAEAVGRCLADEACTGDKLVVGPAVAAEIAGLRQELGGKLSRPMLLRKAPATLVARWQLHVDQGKADLAKRGLDAARLRPLGDPVAVVSGSDTVAVAVMQIHVSKGGPARPYQFYVVLWDQDGAWKLAFVHRFPNRVVRFLRTQKRTPPPSRR